ncbi:MAG: alginate export family protein [Nitrosomonadaceae bacterium]
MINLKSMKMSITSGHKWSPKIILGAGILGLSLQALANPAAPPKAAAAAPTAVSAFDMSKVPLVTPMPRPGLFIVPPAGAGYYSLWDLVTGNERKAPPVAPYAPFGLLPTASFDIDFRYLAKPGYEKDLFDPLKRIKLADDWLVSFGGNFWFRHAHESDSQLGALGAGGTAGNTFNLTRTRLHADIWYQDKFRLFAEGIDARNVSSNLAPLGIDVNHTDMLNLFADIKLADAKGGPAYVRVGRQEMLYGSQRLISTLDWANTRRTFQGVKTFWRNPKLDVDAFWVRPMNVNPQSFDNWDTSRNFYGLWATYKPQRGHFADLYFLSLDNNSSGVAAKAIGTLNVGDSLVHTVGTRYIGDTNNFLYELEGMYQFGQRAGRDISAFAIASGAGYRFATLPMNPQMWLRYDFASGTRNQGDPTNNSNTFNQLFAFGHYYMGFIDRVGRQNIHDLNAQVTFHPQPWLTVITQYHSFYLANKTDGLYNAAGVLTLQDTNGRSGSHVGDEMDLRFNIHVNRHQDVLLGYSKLWAGEFLKTTKPGYSPDLFYVQYSVRF